MQPGRPFCDGRRAILDTNNNSPLPWSRSSELLYGAALYGYGFALATLLTLGTGLALLTRRLNQLEYQTFMLQ